MITAEQANAISFKNSFEKDQVYLMDEISALIEHKASLGKYQVIYTIRAPVASVQYIYKQLRDHGFGVGYSLDKNGYTFVIDW